MAEHSNYWPVAVMCEALEVSRSGYHDSIKTPPIDTVTNELALVTRIKAIHAETRQCDGSRRMAKALQDEGYQVGRHQVRRLMDEGGRGASKTSNPAQTPDHR